MNRISGRQGAVDPTAIGLGVPDRVPERLGGLTGQRAPDASVMVPEMITGQRRPRSSNSVSMNRALGVQRVEDRLDDQEIRATVDQTLMASR